MNINPLFAPTFVLGVVIYAITLRRFAWPKAPVTRMAVALGVLIAALPGAAFAIYYMHWFDKAALFYEFRALPGTELTAAGLGFSIGAVAALGHTKLVRGVLQVAGALILVIFLSVPYIKPVVWPLDYGALKDEVSGKVTRQTSSSTCGPACASTLLRAAGLHATEAEMARECYTSSSGTENWYLTRALRRRGLAVQSIVRPHPTSLPYPSMAGLGFGGGGHFVTVLGKTKQGYIIGDPLSGELTLSTSDVAKYGFSGYFMIARRPR
ncbi:MAG TPA: cysteine peptidase family C39 domain-containing protein [Capsulimonadaceae bacterium]